MELGRAAESALGDERGSHVIMAHNLWGEEYKISLLFAVIGTRKESKYKMMYDKMRR